MDIVAVAKETLLAYMQNGFSVEESISYLIKELEKIRDTKVDNKAFTPDEANYIHLMFINQLHRVGDEILLESIYNKIMVGQND